MADRLGKLGPGEAPIFTRPGALKPSRSWALPLRAETYGKLESLYSCTTLRISGASLSGDGMHDSQPLHYYDESALLERLTVGLKRSDRPVVFLLGSPLAAPLNPQLSGVPLVDGVIDLIRQEFLDPDQRTSFEQAVTTAPNPYQAAFTFLLGRRGPDAANEVIRRAVWAARKPIFGSASVYSPSNATSEESCKSLDTDYDGWAIQPGAEALGRLITAYPQRFGHALLTTNFDPILEVAIGKAGGHYYRTVLHRDGFLNQTSSTGCHVIHLHGYWYGADTLHTPRQLTQNRPRLKASLATLLEGKILVVCGYGGWDDVVTQALMETVLDDSAKPEIVWTFRAKQPNQSERAIQQLAAGIDRGRVGLYAGIDCNLFFPRLLEKWATLEPSVTNITPTVRSTKIVSFVSASISPPSIPASLPLSQSQILEGDDQDHPPLVDMCLGRERELSELASSSCRVCFVTGIGGEGKSTLAAQYYAEAQTRQSFDVLVWRDCKEESERFENQIISLINKLSNGAVSTNELSHQSMDNLTELFLKFAGERKFLLVFDNVDHYVDLENDKMTGASDAFVRAFLRLSSRSRVIFTCRPAITYPSENVLSQRLSGLDVEAAIALFAQRKAIATRSEIEDAHAKTSGHAFWLDLLAAQVSKRAPQLSLADLTNQIGRGGTEIPTSTLQSVWDSLHDREKLVLRTLAESVRPETDVQIGEYLKQRLNFNQVGRGIRSLRSLSLIVVKPRLYAADVFELHPMVRAFVRKTFSRTERIPLIDAIIDVYWRWLGVHKQAVTQRPALFLLQNWTQHAELCIEAEKYQAAFDCLAEVREAFLSGDFPGEFARVAKTLLNSIDWSKFQSFKNFDAVFATCFQVLVNFGRRSEYEPLLERYSKTVPLKDARYINYCDLRCYAAWVREEYPEAIEWGKRGQELSRRSNADTQYNCDHHLALAQRDSGDIDPALAYFLHGVELGKVTAVDEFDDEKGGAFYGNIGRCLHLMGQIDPAIVCYRKSAIAIERDVEAEHVMNQGFIRKWIGELLVMRGHHCLAKAFLEAAKRKWELVRPSRVADLDRTLERIAPQTGPCPHIEEQDLERLCLAWIYGREADFQPMGRN